MTAAVSERHPIHPAASFWLRRVCCGVVGLLVAVSTVGCLDLEQSIVVNQDLTGRAGFKMSMNLEPFMKQMIEMIGARAGGPPPPDAIEQMKQGMATQLGNGIVDVDASKKSLPAGVTLIDATQKLDDMTMVMSFTFAYTDIRKLPEIMLVPTASAAGTARKPIKPFDELEFRDEGANLVIATKTPVPAAAGADPKATASNAGMLDSLMAELNQPGAKEMIGGMMEAMKGMRVAIRIETPLTVVEHNAPAKVGGAMVWEQKLDQLAATPTDKPFDVKPMQVLVRIKKQARP